MSTYSFKVFSRARSALIISVMIQLIVIPSFFGQEPAGSPAPAAANQGPVTAEAERVIVTGSNIPTAEEVGPNPVLNINRDLINKSGERNAEELLRNLPVANANGVPVSNNATGFTSGAEFHFTPWLRPERHARIDRWETRRSLPDWHRRHVFVHRFVHDPESGDREY